jgi:hypothetical protein
VDIFLSVVSEQTTDRKENYVEHNFVTKESTLIFVLDIPVGMYMQKYILILSAVQSQLKHTLAIRNQATGFSSKSRHQAYGRKL